MKQTNSFNFSNPLKSNARKFGMLLLFLAGILSQSLFAQTTYSFVTAGATGSLGPTQAQLNTAYGSTNLNNLVTSNAGIQQFTVPVSGPYRIEARGAQGYGNGFAGRGAVMAGDFNLTAGSVIKILVGQQGVLPVGTAYNNQFGGGGGSFVADASNNPMVVAGGGGGSWATAFTTMSDGTVAVNGSPGFGGTGTTSGPGGTSGNGGGTGTSADGGGGFTGNGLGTAGGKSFINGGNGGVSGANGIGGFGGGGGTSSQNYRRGAGGGGYSGGGGTYQDTDLSGAPEGGGGGSFNNGLNQTNTSGANTGPGLVVISFLCNVNVGATTSLTCSGAAVTLTTNAVSTYSWSTGNTTTTSIVVNPTVTTTYSIMGHGTVPSGCTSTAVITITVNNTPTVTINSSATSACQGQSVTLTASGANTYTWNNSVVNGTPFVPSGGTTTYVVTGGNACGTASAAVTLTISTLPVTAVTSSTLVCSGSPATLTAGGATTYSWAPGASTQTNNVVTPAVTTVYTLTGISGPCSSSAMVTVSTKTLPAISIVSASTSLCYGNSLNLNASGDATTYSWSTGQTGTSITVSPTITSVYSLTGTNVVNCTKTISQIYVVNPNPVASISVSDPEVCSGGSSTLTASGAATFNWVGGPATATRVVNPVSNQTYTVSVINPTTSCHTETMITVTVFVPVLPVSGNTTVCTGSNVTIGASGAISYTWTNDPSNSQSIVVNPTVNTTYMVTGSVVNPINGITCPATNTIEVDVFTPPTITATGNYTAICRGISASLTAAGAGATGTYTWAAGLGNNPVVSVAPILNQLYSVSGTDGNGCKGTATVQVLVDGCTGITTIAANSINLSVYPNPASGEFTIASDQSLTLYIVNELGQQVKEITLNSTMPQVKINNLANGVYFITGRNINGSVKQKIVIAK